MLWINRKRDGRLSRAVFLERAKRGRGAQPAQRHEWRGGIFASAAAANCRCCRRVPSADELLASNCSTAWGRAATEANASTCPKSAHFSNCLN
jgi:hypothetical protein